MKAYSDLEQSKKLAEILPLESADMYYFLDPTPAGNIYHLVVQRIDFGVKTREPEYNEGDIPCWSLSALLDVLPKQLHIVLAIDDEQGEYAIGSVDTNLYDSYADNPVDACVGMIAKLKEYNLL